METETEISVEKWTVEQGRFVNVFGEVVAVKILDVRKRYNDMLDVELLLVVARKKSPQQTIST